MKSSISFLALAVFISLISVACTSARDKDYLSTNRSSQYEQENLNAPRIVQSKVVSEIDVLDQNTMTYIEDEARRKNYNLSLKDTMFVCTLIGNEDSATVYKSGKIEICRFREIKKLDDIEEFRTSFIILINMLKECARGRMSTVDAGACWNSMLTIYATKANIYKRISIPNFVLSYQLKIPNSYKDNIKEAKWSITTRCNNKYRLVFIIDDFDYPFIWCRKKDCGKAACILSQNITDRCRFGEHSISITTFRRSPGHPILTGPEKNMVLELLLAEPKRENFTVKNAQGTAVQSSNNLEL